MSCTAPQNLYFFTIFLENSLNYCNECVWTDQKFEAWIQLLLYSFQNHYYVLKSFRVLEIARSKRYVRLM